MNRIYEQVQIYLLHSHLVNDDHSSAVPVNLHLNRDTFPDPVFLQYLVDLVQDPLDVTDFHAHCGRQMFGVVVVEVTHE